MKKLLLFIGAFLCLFSLRAQFTLETHDGISMDDGDVFTFDEYGNSYSILGWYVNNPQPEAIPMRVRLVSAKNADGSETKLCFGLCYTPIEVGGYYPADAPVMIPPGEHQGSSGDHIMNFAENDNDGDDTNNIIEYVLEFYQVGDRGGQPVGETITITYRYDKFMGVEEMNKLQIAVYPTIVHDILNVETEEVLNMKVYDLQGRLVEEKSLSIGKNAIEMSNLASQMYLMRFENKQGETQTAKVIVE